jgi:hypothetical protein
MWQQRTTKYSTNSFKYVAAENNKVWYKCIQVCGSSLYCTLLFSAATYLNEFVLYFVVLCCHILNEFVPYLLTKYSTNSFKYVAAENNKVWYKCIQVCGSREQQSTVQTHSSMWQQRTTKYGTNSFKYVAAENNKVQYKLIQVCTYLNEFVLYFVVLCCHILE